MTQSQTITPNLWFDGDAEAAAEYYVSVFDDGNIGSISHYDAAMAAVSGQPEGGVLTVPFEIGGYHFVALNGGSQFTINPSISFMVNCPTPGDVDTLWERLAEGGEELMPLDSYPFSERYGWTNDKFGVSWQLIAADETSDRRIAPSLMFVGERCGQAEAALDFYTGIFPDATIGGIARYGPDQDPDEEGTVMFADVTLAGQRFTAMDSAQDHAFEFTKAISFVVDCDDQDAVDYYWNRLTADGGEEGQCGWLTDQFGVSWQVVPSVLRDLLQDADGGVSEAMLDMRKLDIATLEAAAGRVG